MRRSNAGACVALVALSSMVPVAVVDATNKDASASAGSTLLGVWKDRRGDLLPPGVSHFEAIDSRIVFAAGGKFTLTLDKATGPLRQAGSYTVEGHVLTLHFPFDTVSYGFSRAGNRLTLERCGRSPIVMWVS